MATLKAIRDTYDRDPHFKERILQLVSATSVSIYDLEILFLFFIYKKHWTNGISSVQLKWFTNFYINKN